MKKLLLASKSPSRRYLLAEAAIPFEVIEQSADESVCDWTLPIEQLVASIARHKMEHALLEPGAHEGQKIFVVSADTLCCDTSGKIYGKPENYEEAREAIKNQRNGSRVVTSFCLERKIWKDGCWQIERTVQKTVIAECYFEVPDEEISSYFKQHPIALQTAGAIAIEHYGLRYLRSINGSYTTIIGLPIFELHQALYDLEFFTEAV